MLQTYTRRRSHHASPVPFLIGTVLILVIVATFQMLRGLPAIEATTTVQASTVIGSARPLPLPAAGSSALAVDGLGTLGAAGEQVPRPIASVTKIMTAYVILKDKPLQPGQPGPAITITPRDVTRYVQMIAEDQSAQPVSAGLVFSELELLQGLIVPSANNFGEILANWNSGSVEAFVARMNAEAQALGMTKTTYADTSGFSDRTVSTLQDQMVLAREAMKNPVFAQIVAMPSVRLPGIGVANSTNQALGQDGIVGIKTGFTEEAGGNLVFAAQRDVNGQRVLMIGGALGQVDRPAAFEASRRLVVAASQGLQVARVVTAGQAVATIKPEWQGAVELVAAEDVSMLLWPGSSLEATVEYNQIEAPLAPGAAVGSLILKLGEQERRVPIVLREPLRSAGIAWRLTRL